MTSYNKISKYIGIIHVAPYQNFNLNFAYMHIGTKQLFKKTHAYERMVHRLISGSDFL